MALALRTILDRAGAAAHAQLAAHAQVQLKSDGSQVTEADRAAEAVIVEGLTAAFPGTGIISEEGARASGSGGTWYVDPIDGTSAMVEGLAHWGPTVGLVVDGRVEVGALWIPRLREFWFAQRGVGAWRDDHRLSIPPDAPITANSPLYVPSRIHVLPSLPWPGKIRSLGSTAVHMAQAGRGAAAAAAVGRYAPWDVVCGIVLVEEAGGVITDWQAQPLDPLEAKGAPFLAGSLLAVREVSSLLNPVLDGFLHGR
jgi:myo-inositol-1(or 4)-monophosphatase